MIFKLRARRLVSSISLDARLALALNPEEALARYFGAHVVAVEELGGSRGAGGWCDGVSLTTDRVVCYAPSPGSRRQNFTLLHELGHILVNSDDDSLDWLADRPASDVDLERLCDAIAAEILLPEQTINQVLAGAEPTVDHLGQLYAASRASEEVCAIALAGRLTVRGAVVLIRRSTATVAFAATSGWPPLPIARGLTIPPRHPLRDLGTRQRWFGWTTADLRIALVESAPRSLPLSGPEDLLQAQAVAGPRRTTAILCDIKRAGLLTMEPTDEACGGTSESLLAQSLPTCPRCGVKGASFPYPCDECGIPPCPACGRCQCF